MLDEEAQAFVAVEAVYLQFVGDAQAGAGAVVGGVEEPRGAVGVAAVYFAQDEAGMRAAEQAAVQHFKGVGEYWHGQRRAPGFELFEVARPVEVQEGGGQFAVDVHGFGRDGRAVGVEEGAVDGVDQRRVVFAFDAEAGGSGVAAVAQGVCGQVAGGGVQQFVQGYGADGAQ